MNIVPIVFAFDNNLVMPACICISSLMMNAQEDTFYNIFILYSEREDLRKEELNKIPIHYPNCRINYRTVDDTFDKAFEIRGITSTTYYRLLIPELIPEYDKIIYSDVDVIFRYDLFDLYATTDLDGYYVAGVNSLSYLLPDVNEYYIKNLEIDPTSTIYAGNLIINSKALLRDGVVAEFKDLAKEQYRFQDMDILNIACMDKIKYLPPFYCLTTYINQLAICNRESLYKEWSESEIEDALKRGIVHYNGQKPWKGYCVNFDIWWEYYRKSPFFDERYYFDFFYSKLNVLDQLSLWKRIKILSRYFIYGKRKI